MHFWASKLWISIWRLSPGSGSQLLVGTTRNSILAGNMELSFREVVLGHFDEVIPRTQRRLNCFWYYSSCVSYLCTLYRYGVWQRGHPALSSSRPVMTGQFINVKNNHHATEIGKHRRNNYNKDTKPQMLSLLVFNRVYRLEIQSVMLVFSTPLVKYCPSNLLTGSPSPLFPLPV